MSALIVAHRGARGLVPFENTLEAFDKAVELGAHMVEFDVQRSLDGVLAIHHDDALPDGRLIGQVTMEELRADALARGFVAPTLVETVDALAGRIRLDVEVKGCGYEAEVLAVLLDRLSLEDFVMTSFHDAFVREVKMLEPRVEVGLLLGVDAPRDPVRRRLSELFPAARARACRADFVAPHHALVRAGFVRRMHRAGFPVFVWTVNEAGLMNRLLALGVDGLITDRPDIGLEAVLMR